MTASAWDGVFQLFWQAGSGLAAKRSGKDSTGDCEGPLRNQTKQLQGGETEHPEHQVAHHLGGSTHPHGPAAMVVLQPAIDPLGRAAFAVTNVFRPAMPDQPLPLRLLLQFLLQPGGGTRI